MNYKMVILKDLQILDLQLLSVFCYPSDFNKPNALSRMGEVLSKHNLIFERQMYHLSPETAAPPAGSLWQCRVKALQFPDTTGACTDHKGLNTTPYKTYTQ